MNIALATYDMIPEKAHLMPWRTLCEIASHINKGADTACVFNLIGHKFGPDYENKFPCATVAVNKNRSVLCSSLNKMLCERKIDILYWPVTWRDPKWRIDMLATLDVEVVAYFPGGVYGISSAFYAMRKLGIKAALPYIRDSLASKQRVLGRLQKSGVRKLIGLTEYTVEVSKGSGWPEQDAHFVSLAKDSQELASTQVALPDGFKKWCDDSPYYLFMGPPSGIRGIYELLSAFERAATMNKDIRLVCLFRSDAELESQRIKSKIEDSKVKNRIYTTWRSVDRPALNAYIAKSHAIVMPFVLVPSEIPLAIIEAMQFSKPIISTRPGGTGEFVKRFGYAPSVGDVEGLAAAMIELAEYKSIYKEKCDSVKKHREALPSWEQMSASWLDIGYRALERKA